MLSILRQRAPLVALGALLLPGCRDGAGWRSVEAATRQRYPDVARVSADSLAVRLARGPAPILVDVRTAGEYAVSHLAGARRVEPNAPASALAGVPKDADIVVYCSVGARSSAFAGRLMEAGYTRVANLDGSIFRWANEGRAVVRDGRPVREVHPYDRLWGRLLDRKLHAYRPGEAG